MKAKLIACIAALLFVIPVVQAAKPKPASFESVADRALAAMEKRARELNVTGAAVVAFAQGDAVTGWSSKMMVVGSFRKPPAAPAADAKTAKDAPPKDLGANLLAIAYAKASEMAETLKDSGNAGRPPMRGENGWKGGVIKATKRGLVIAAFSGGPSEDDVKISQAGLDLLAEAL